MSSENNTIYGSHLPEMNRVMAELIEIINSGSMEIMKTTGMVPVEHIKSRIKSDESMREKCRRRGLLETEENALSQLYDAIGLRVICPFLDDVYAVRDYINSWDEIEVIQEKDYIRNVKPNGYRSLHMLIRFQGYHAEIQIRTISMDTWAALEHHIRYKKRLEGNTSLIFDELKRCADELASTDASMQTIRSLLSEKE